jgi:hypothetical protein
VSGTISYPDKMVALKMIGPDTGDRVAQSLLQPLLQQGMGINVRVVVNAGPKSSPSLDERDFETCLAKNIRGDAASGAASDDANVKGLFWHCLPTLFWAVVIVLQ